MDVNEYQVAAMRTNGTENNRDMLINSALGLAGESGEFADHIKKVAFHGHPLDYAAARKELGDVCWYLAQAATAIGADLSDIMRENIYKLLKRYPKSFSTADSIARVDVQMD